MHRRRAPSKRPPPKRRTRLFLGHLGQRLRLIGTAFAIVFFGTAGLVYFLERAAPDTKIASVADSLWMCLVTMSTVGYGDVYPVTGAGRLVVGLFILFTVVTIGFLLTAVSEAVLEVKRMEELGLSGTQMRGHIVLCGFGPLARTALDELLAVGRQVALLCETTEEMAQARQRSGKRELFVTFGEATQDLLRDRLNLDAADAAIIAYGDDTKSMIAALNVRALSPALRVVVALQRDELRRTLIASGVTYVASPHELSGRLVASAAFEPAVAILLEEMASGQVGEHDTQQHQPGKLAGLSVAQVRAKLDEIDGPLLVGVEHWEDGASAVVAHPRRDLVVSPRDRLLVLATPEQSSRMEQRFETRQDAALAPGGDAPAP